MIHTTVNLFSGGVPTRIVISGESGRYCQKRREGLLGRYQCAMRLKRSFVDQASNTHKGGIMSRSSSGAGNLKTRISQTYFWRLGRIGVIMRRGKLAGEHIAEKWGFLAVTLSGLPRFIVAD